ncbi:hypothetical protein GGD83_001450 [Rhodoblastus sphagnicola]|nr:hypothetical protein [Rhodoblastus sphagnicola]MBB4197658.1 hypothetical protein [Rhodoblastus sphagnicola]
MSDDKPSADVFQLLTASTTRRLLQTMRDACAEAEDDPFVTRAAPEVVLSAGAAKTAGRSVIFASDGAVAAPDWLVLCETRAAREGAGAVFGFARRLPGAAEPREFARLAHAVLFARAATPAELDHYAGEVSRRAMSRQGFLTELLSSPEAMARRWRFALLPLDGELSAVFGVEGFDDLAPPRFVIED